MVKACALEFNGLCFGTFHLCDLGTSLNFSEPPLPFLYHENNHPHLTESGKDAMMS